MHMLQPRLYWWFWPRSIRRRASPRAPCRFQIPSLPIQFQAGGSVDALVQSISERSPEPRRPFFIVGNRPAIHFIARTRADGHAPAVDHGGTHEADGCFFGTEIARTSRHSRHEFHATSRTASHRLRPLRRTRGISLRPFAAAAFLAIAGSAAPTQAQTWTTKQPVRIVVPLSAGSAIDLVARLVFDEVAKQTQQTIIVENRPGASQTLGAIAVAKSRPDGYTILVAGSALSVVQSTMPNLNLNVLSDLKAVALLANIPLVMVVSPSKGYKTLADFVGYAKSNANAVTYGSAGRGDSTHLAAERLRLAAGFSGLYVPFRGATEVLTEIMAGRLDFYLSPMAAALSSITAGRLQALAVASAKRAAALPGVPTTVEAGFPNSDYEFWVGAFVSANTSTGFVSALHGDILNALQAPSVQQRLNTLGGEVASKTPEEFAEQVGREIRVNATVVKEAGLAN
jgi:tripartite-type tricarboxylate transporter receptor subunit TctC